MSRCKVIVPHNIIEFQGEKMVEVEWPEDSRYNIGYQLAQETERDGRRYMGLFESAAKRVRTQRGYSDGNV